MIRLLLASKPVRWLVGAVALLGAGFAAIGLIRRDAAQDATKEIEHEYERETSRRVEAGRVALRDAGDGDADSRVSGNDDSWQ